MKRIIPKWWKQDARSLYVKELFFTHLNGGMEDVVKREVQHALLSIRLRYQIDPWLFLAKRAALAGVYVLNTVWRHVCGRYRKARKKVDRGSTQAAGASAGTSTPALQTGWVAATQSAEQAIAHAGIRAGEITAFRCWILQPDGFLHSVYRSEVVWIPGQILEGDVSQENQGVHGFKTRLGACKYMGDSAESVFVSGTVELWGDVIEHERGYRASKARITSIDDSPYYDAAALRGKYGLTVKRKKK